jgi:ribose/xylose/arabinose/galactoside ABC-type transport system permease subunit
MNTTSSRLSLLRNVVADRRILLVVLIVLTGIFMSALSPYFFHLDNLLSMTQYGAIIGLLALGQAIVILGGGGGIDLSIGSIMSLSAVAMGLVTQNLGMNPWLAAVVAIAVGVGLGAVNAFLIAALKLPPLIVTLSTLFLYGSLALVITGGGQLGGFDSAGFPALGQSTVLGIPTQVVAVLLPAFAVAIWAQHRTRFGRRLLQIGTSEKAASLAGVGVSRLRFSFYCISGALAALAAVVSNAWLLTARPGAGLGLELLAITIAVLGGIDIFGGRGHLSGVFLAVLLVVVLTSGLQLAGVGNSIQGGILGLLLVAAALLNNLVARRSR